MRLGGPDQLIAEIISRLPDGGDLEVLSEWVVELRSRAMTSRST